MTIPLIRFGVLEGVSHAVSTRTGGMSPPPYDSLNFGYATADTDAHVLSNRKAFTDAIGVSYADVASGRLSHGKHVHVFSRARPGTTHADSAPVRRESSRSEPAFWADGVVSDVPGLHVMMTCADCVPLLFADRRLGVVGAAHAGWRGTAQGVGPAVIHAMEIEFGSRPADIVAAIGPSIGPCCYDVREEVPRTFLKNGFPPVLASVGGFVHLDLWATNERQLLDCGIKRAHIENPHLCTRCHVDTFFSHRGEHGTTGRFGLCIGISRNGTA